MRRTWPVLVTVLAGLVLAGCPAAPGDQLEYRMGVARIGDDYHLFTPACPGDALSGVEVHDPPAFPDDDHAALLWWAASGAKDPAGQPWEFVALGDDEPFQRIAVRAGSNGLAPAMPTYFRVTATYTDGYGGELHKSLHLQVPGVPTYPAGTDPRQVRYLTRPLGDMGELAGPEEIRSHSDCAGGTETPLRQTADSMRSGAPGRADRAMLGPDAVDWLTPLTPGTAPVEDVAAHLCGNGPGFGALVAAFGQERVWREPDFDVETGAEIRQFTGAYGRITAAEAIAQVDGRLGCEKYTDEGTEYHDVHPVAPAAAPGVERQLLYCEESEHTAGRCTLLLARGDTLSRVVVQAADSELAETAARALAGDAAAALTG
ncbi:hypothetical protein [Actinoplanes sp. CA-252034]|uniref:hypothetical protein n=1 Tax=Actinoplanes sp. CA-252034 TaxID=3239906 RepID=UPI003D99D122